jgi:hypothetical protein
MRARSSGLPRPQGRNAELGYRKSRGRTMIMQSQNPSGRIGQEGEDHEQDNWPMPQEIRAECEAALELEKEPSGRLADLRLRTPTDARRTSLLSRRWLRRRAVRLARAQSRRFATRRTRVRACRAGADRRARSRSSRKARSADVPPARSHQRSHTPNLRLEQRRDRDELARKAVPRRMGCREKEDQGQVVQSGVLADLRF